MTDYQKAILIVANAYMKEYKLRSELSKKVDEMKSKMRNKEISHVDYVSAETWLETFQDQWSDSNAKIKALTDIREDLMNLDGAMKDWSEYERDKNGIVKIY